MRHRNDERRVEYTDQEDGFGKDGAHLGRPYSCLQDGTLPEERHQIDEEMRETLVTKACRDDTAPLPIFEDRGSAGAAKVHGPREVMPMRQKLEGCQNYRY